MLAGPSLFGLSISLSTTSFVRYSHWSLNFIRQNCGSFHERASRSTFECSWSFKHHLWMIAIRTARKMYFVFARSSFVLIELDQCHILSFAVTKLPTNWYHFLLWKCWMFSRVRACLLGVATVLNFEFAALQVWALKLVFVFLASSSLEKPTKKRKQDA